MFIRTGARRHIYNVTRASEPASQRATDDDDDDEARGALIITRAELTGVDAGLNTVDALAASVLLAPQPSPPASQPTPRNRLRIASQQQQQQQQQPASTAAMYPSDSTFSWTRYRGPT